MKNIIKGIHKVECNKKENEFPNGKSKGKQKTGIKVKIPLYKHSRGRRYKTYGRSVRQCRKERKEILHGMYNERNDEQDIKNLVRDKKSGKQEQDRKGVLT
ncbi:hypothetical protein RUM43_003580 [Polyplax serrata]|uniref:Uncharacterized protein n=1 Tax=Polyplax serrata TaxID=468196 RepID=A0AAN8PFR5_POLSC